MLFVVFFFVKSDHSLDIKFVKNWNIFLRMVSVSLVLISSFDWSHKCHEFSWDNPVEVTVFDSLIVFILFDIECLEIVPAEFDCVLQTLKTLKKGAIIKTVSF